MAPVVRSGSASAASRRPITAIRPVASTNRQAASTLGPWNRPGTSGPAARWVPYGRSRTPEQPGRDLVAGYGMPEGRALDVMLAVHELAANAIEHGGGTGRLRMSVTNQELICRIIGHRCVRHASERHSRAPHAGFSGACANGDHLVYRGQLENPGHHRAGADKL
jgi:hypothetical protein